MAFLTVYILLVKTGKARVLLKITMAQFCSSVPVGLDSLKVSQHVQYLDSETEAATPQTFYFIKLNAQTCVHVSIFTDCEP